MRSPFPVRNPPVSGVPCETRQESLQSIAHCGWPREFVDCSGQPHCHPQQSLGPAPSVARPVQGREHDLDPQSRESRRIHVPAPRCLRSLSPHLLYVATFRNSVTDRQRRMMSHSRTRPERNPRLLGEVFGEAICLVGPPPRVRIRRPDGRQVIVTLLLLSFGLPISYCLLFARFHFVVQLSVSLPALYLP
jgi:hypothetical protein